MNTDIDKAEEIMDIINFNVLYNIIWTYWYFNVNRKKKTAAKTIKGHTSSIKIFIVPESPYI